jgi:tetratricopeptide (TPR) repeat protein
MLQQTDLAVTGIQDHLKNYGDNPLLLFFAGTLAIKNSQSEQALQYLKQAEKKSSGLQVPYVHYQLGEIYLHKGEYDQSIQQYQKFLKEYKGQNFVKDAWYKTAVCYYLKGDKQKANMPFEKAKQEGKESTEADKYAARSLAENQLPNVKLSKIRYATDGGYYEEAKKIATIVTPDELPTVKEKIEFTYRKARLAHKGGDELTAISLYKETIEQQQTEAWYFAPNACLQLGYIASDQKNSEVAAYWFNKALNYKKHEYKNSIDTKAKSALANLKK